MDKSIFKQCRGRHALRLGSKSSQVSSDHATPAPIRNWAPALFSLSAAVLLQGCILPQSAPLRHDVEASNAQAKILLTPVTANVAAASRQSGSASFPPFYLKTQPVDYTQFAAGDGVDVVVWERDSLNMFPSTSNGVSDLGVFIVDSNGDIQAPYIGKLRIGGLTSTEARAVLLRKLRGIVIASDVRLSPTDLHGRLVTIQGNVTKAGVFPIGPSLLRLSGALVMAAPDQSAPDQTLVTLRRAGAVGAIMLSDVYRDPDQDIALLPGDSIVVSTLQQYVTVLGAVGSQGRIRISKRNYSVLDALADSRGAADSSADIRALYLIRLPLATSITSAAPRPIVYGFNISRPEEMALAKQFAVQDGDALFVSDAPFTQVQKVLSSLTATLGTARSVTALGQ